MTEESVARSANMSRPLQNGTRRDAKRSVGKGQVNCYVCVIDDDASMRRSLVDLLESVGISAKEFGSAADVIGERSLGDIGCFVVDIRMPGVSGLEFQSYLQKSGVVAPIIFMTGHADVPMTVQAMKAGAVDFLTKPFREQEMLDAVTRAVALNTARLRGQMQAVDTLSRFETLSGREREVMALVTAGLMNKQVAARMDVAISTVKTHRTQIMKKMGAKSLADLVRMAEQLQLKTPDAK